MCLSASVGDPIRSHDAIAQRQDDGRDRPAVHRRRVHHGVALLALYAFLRGFHTDGPKDRAVPPLMP